MFYTKGLMLPRRLSLMLMEGHKTPMYHGLVINSNEERDGEILTYENKYMENIKR